MAAFVSSLVVLLVGIGIALFIGRRRPLGTPLTWGEAFVGGTFVFAMFVMAYGVIPHQWLNWADNELGWRPDKVLMVLSSAGVRFGKNAPGIPGRGRIIISYQALRDVIAASLYGVFLVGQMVLWSKWQKRGRAGAEVEPTSRFGRPVIRKA